MKLTPFRFAVAAILALIFVTPSQAVTQEVDCVNGPHFTIQAGVNAAAPGDVVVVHPCGGYSDGFAVIARNDLRIVGAGVPASMVGAYPVGAGINPPANPLIFDFTSTCVHIENSSDISVVGLLLEACIDNGVTILDSERINIQGNALYFAGYDGVAISNSQQVDIVGNFLYGAHTPGHFGITTDGTSNFVKIQNNRVMRNWHGILMEGDHIDVINNEVSDNVDIGIQVLSNDSTVSRNTTLGNGSGTQIDFNAMPANTCVVGNETNVGIQPWMVGCQSSNN